MRPKLALIYVVLMTALAVAFALSLARHIGQV
jgi:hypothetical protein